MARKILFVDDEMDNPQLQKLFYRALSLKFDVRIVVSGEACLSLLRTGAFQPDLFLLDVQMPDMDGVTLFHHIRGWPEYQLTPVVFLTSYTHRITGLLKAMAVDHVTKPVNLEELLERLDVFLERTNAVKWE